MSALIFVSTELAPFTTGGVGRVLHNILRTLNGVDRSRSIVLLIDTVVNTGAFNAIFPGVRLLQLDTTQDALRYAHGRRVPPDWAFSDSRWHWRSASIMLTLENLAREMPIEYVEFPDWGGLAFCTLQERRFSGLLPTACLAVRLHSTHTAILNAEANTINNEDLNICDMERKCLRDCDLVIAQLPKLADVVRSMMAFSVEEWDHRVKVHAPPVLLDHHELVVKTTVATSTQSLMFTSKIQRFKRPDVFVRGVSTYMRTQPSYQGKAFLSALRVDTGYAVKVDSLIPADQHARFVSIPYMSQQEREATLAKATVIITSGFESFCLTAFEASLLGARVILNAENPAFDDLSPWQDGVNCYKFDGTASGLAKTIERNFSCQRLLVPVQLRNDPWPWENWQLQSKNASLLKLQQAAISVEAPLVSVVVPHFNLGKYLNETLANVFAINHRNIEIIVVDDASTDPDSVRAIETLACSDDLRLKVIRLKGNVGLAGARNIGIRHTTGDYVLTLDADDLIHPNFVNKAVGALERHTDFDVVITNAAYFPDGEIPSMQTLLDAANYAVFTGEARTAGILENRFSTATALFRRSALERFRYNEDLHCYEDWSLYMRMCDAGLRFIVTTDAFFFYRHRHNSMVHAPREGAMRRIEYSDLLRTSAPATLRTGSMHFVLGLASHSAPPLPIPVVAGAQLAELLHRTANMENMLHNVQHATMPFVKMFRIPRYFWQRLLPLRMMIARTRKVPLND